MLILSRKNQECVMVGVGGGLDRVLKITVLEVAAGKVKLGFEADADIPVHRLEVWERNTSSSSMSRRAAVLDETR